MIAFKRLGAIHAYLLLPSIPLCAGQPAVPQESTFAIPVRVSQRLIFLCVIARLCFDGDRCTHMCIEFVYLEKAFLCARVRPAVPAKKAVNRQLLRVSQRLTFCACHFDGDRSTHICVNFLCMGSSSPLLPSIPWCAGQARRASSKKQ